MQGGDALIWEGGVQTNIQARWADEDKYKGVDADSYAGRRCRQIYRGGARFAD